MKNLQILSKNEAIVSFFSVIVLYLCYFLLFDSYLNSDDDRPVSMLLAGVFQDATQNILFQNILIGFFFKYLYSIAQWYWYDTFIVLLLFLSHWAIFYALLRLKINFWLIFSFFIYIILSQLSYINFTTTAAYLGIAGIVLFFVYQKNKENYYFMATFFLLVSSLIRFQSTVLVIILFTPFFLYQIWLKNIDYKKYILFFGINSCLIFSLAFFDRFYPNSLDEDWQEVYEFQKVRPHIFDYDAIPFKPYEDIYKKYNFSENDLLIFRAYVFYWADPTFFTSERLKNMLSEVDRFSIKYIRLRGVKEVPSKFFSVIASNFYYIAALLLTLSFIFSKAGVIIFSLQATLVFFLYFFLIIFFKTVGYVDYVVFSLFSIISLLTINESKLSIKIHNLVAFCIVLSSIYHTFSTHKNLKDIQNKQENFFESLPNDKIYLGVSFHHLYQPHLLFKPRKPKQDIFYYMIAPNYQNYILKKYNINTICKDIVNRDDVVLIFLEANMNIQNYYKVYMKEHYHQDIYFEKIADRYDYQLYKIKSK